MDDLLDLDWNNKKPAISGSSRPAASSSYAFDSLARASPNLLQPQRSSTPQQAAAKPTKPIPAAQNRDAFADLFDMGNGSAAATSTSSSPAKQTMAQKQPPARPEAAWSASSAGRDAFEQAASINSTSTKPAVARATQNTRPAPKAVPKDPFDFSDFEDPGNMQTSAFDLQPQPAAQEANDEDDVLGMLGQPVTESASARRSHSPAAASAPPPRRSRPRPASPPPHLLGQIVEMGFSPQEARQALAQTADGLDVQAALESLLAGRTNHADSDEQLARRLQSQEGRDTELEEYEAKERRRREARRRRDDPQPRQQQQQREDEGPDWQKQADQLYAQASELGANVFSKANAFWTQAKSQAQKALEERSAAAAAAGGSAGGSGRGTPEGRASPAAWARKLAAGNNAGAAKKEWSAASGKPRWMVEAEEAEAREHSEGPSTQDNGQEGAPASGGFKDSDNEDEPAPSFIPRAPQASRVPVKPKPVVEDLPPSARFKAAAAPESAASSSSGSSSKGYASSARWGRSKAPASSSPSSSSPAPTPKPVAARARTLCSSDQQPYPPRALSLKSAGNDAFKLGSYGEAEANYTSALDALAADAESLRRIPLLNNRANARIKNGDASAAARDCTQVLELIRGREGEGEYRPSLEAPLPAELAAEVNLRDSYGKALLRRAQAYEMLERYLPAYKDWEVLLRYEKSEGSGSANGVKNLRAAQEGVKRVQGAMRKDKKPTSAATSTPARPAARPSRPSAAAVRAGEAGRQRVRAANAAAAAEESAAHSLKDSIDSRISAWTQGGSKAGNIRALLCSLETVIGQWPELGWKKVGMNEVLTEPQVKKVYTRAIAKLHPDKLTPGRASLEQRLVGKEVFSVLNEAFAASQSA